jgi:hypothetical protein
LAAAGAGDAAGAGRGEGAGAAVAAVCGFGAAGGFGADAELGSGVMIFTAGVEAEVGNSALVGLPVGTDGGSPAIRPAAACVCAGTGAFHDDA